jgi:hypothetical protein
MNPEVQRYFRIRNDRGRADKAIELLRKADDLTPRQRTLVKVKDAEGDKLVWTEESLAAQGRLRAVLKLLDITFGEVKAIDRIFK